MATEKSEKSGWEVFGKFAAELVLAPLSIALQSWIAQKFWLWFLTPVFEKEPPALWLCCGVMLLARLAVTPRRKSDEDEGPLTMAVSSSLVYLLILGFGWLVKTFGPMLGH